MGDLSSQRKEFRTDNVLHLKELLQLSGITSETPDKFRTVIA